MFDIIPSQKFQMSVRKLPLVFKLSRGFEVSRREKKGPLTFLIKIELDLLSSGGIRRKPRVTSELPVGGGGSAFLPSQTSGLQSREDRARSTQRDGKCSPAWLLFITADREPVIVLMMDTRCK